MTGFLEDWIINIITIVMILVLLEILIPSGKMKKYVNLVTGFILVIAIINPFVGIIGSKANIVDFQLINADKLDRSEIQKNSKTLERNQMNQIAEVYRKKLIKQLEQTAAKEIGSEAVKADVVINDDYMSENFGEIKRVYLYLSNDGEAVSKPVVKIEKIKIGKENNESEEHENRSIQVEAGLKSRLENRIAGLFGIDKEAIVITREGS